jgi:hypothetical protein
MVFQKKSQIQNKIFNFFSKEAKKKFKICLLSETLQQLLREKLGHWEEMNV